MFDSFFPCGEALFLMRADGDLRGTRHDIGAWVWCNDHYNHGVPEHVTHFLWCILGVDHLLMD